jgi:tetratricopeptide (TPR) repeat protein
MIDGFDPHLALERARRLMLLGNRRGAIEALRALLAGDPDHALGHALLSLCLRDEKRLHAARHEARLALQTDPELAMGLYALAMVELASGKLRRAQQALDHALALSPGEPLFLRGLATVQLNRGRRTQARETLERALQSDPSDAHALVALGEIHLLEGRLADANRCATDAQRLEPEAVEVLVLQGRLLLAQGRVQEAQDHALWALSSDANDAGALRLLVEIKACGSFWLGLWWRYATFMSRVGESRQILLLTFAFGAYRAFDLACENLGWKLTSDVVEVLWIAFAVYSWVGPALFRRMLQKEMKQVTLRPDF